MAFNPGDTVRIIVQIASEVGGVIYRTLKFIIPSGETIDWVLEQVAKIFQRWLKVYPESTAAILEIR